MSKILNLKRWVTVPEAARHLTQIMSEPVAEADVLQFALDGHIKLSVNFPNQAKARIGQVRPFKDVKKSEVPTLDGERLVLLFDGYPIHDLRPGEPIADEEPFVCFDKNVVTIDGVWDLAMLGGDRIDVESDLHRLIDGPEVSMMSLDGTFLNREDGVWALLQARLDDRIEVDKNNGDKEIVNDSYYPVGGLGRDCVKVVRTTEILAFQSSLNGADSSKPLGNRERDTLLSIIGVVCEEAGFDYTRHAKTARLIKDMAALKGVSIGETTIEGHLKKIPDALAARMT